MNRRRLAEWSWLMVSLAGARARPTRPARAYPILPAAAHVALTVGRGHAHMFWMGRVLRSLAAVVATVALVAMLPVPCGCAPERRAPAQAAGHECCAPPAGVSSNDHGCCDGHHDGEANLLTPGSVPVPSLSDVAVVRVEQVARLDTASHGSILLSPSPPPAVLRI